ncbi:hypothetical protein TNCV_4528471 [Trichonephila clavipes]|nr:hypothetical protein TNCV_4528471 [Trichonephila clavipes]
MATSSTCCNFIPISSKLEYTRAGATYSSNFHHGKGRGGRVLKVSDHGWPCHGFEAGITQDPLCRGVMHVKSVESSNILPWSGVVVRRWGGMPAQVSSTSLVHGSK